MSPEELEVERRIAAGPTVDAILRIAAGLPADELAGLLTFVADHLCEPSLTVASALQGAGIHRPAAARRLAHHLGRSLRDEITARRIEIARRLRQPDVFPTGRVAAAVGIPAWTTFARAWRLHTGEEPRIFRFPDRLTPDFNYATWFRVRRRRLAVEDARLLVARLHRIYAAGAERTDEPGPTRRDDLGRREPAIFEPVAVRAVRPVWQRAAGEALEALRRDGQGLPCELVRLFDHLEAHLFDPEFSVRSAAEALGFLHSTLASSFVFYRGETVTAYVEKRRIETALRLLVESELPVREVAEAVGMEPRGLRRAFKLRTGELPTAVRGPGEEGTGPDEALWRRVGRGEAFREEVAEVARWLAALRPDAFAAEELEIDVPTQRTITPTRTRTTTTTTTTRSTSLPVLAAAPVLAAPRPESRTVRTLRRRTTEDEATVLDAVALLLSRHGAGACRRREGERVLAESPERAPVLFRLREIQCAVNAAAELERNGTARGELWARWLAVRARSGGDGEVTLAQWQAVEQQLPDAPAALARWRDADEKRRRLREMTADERGRVIADEGSEFRCYLVARDVGIAARAREASKRRRPRWRSRSRSSAIWWPASSPPGAVRPRSVRTCWSCAGRVSRTRSGSTVTSASLTRRSNAPSRSANASDSGTTSRPSCPVSTRPSSRTRASNLPSPRRTSTTPSGSSRRSMSTSPPERGSTRQRSGGFRPRII
jgi:transcriptional regulator GlxA family with amidase domain